LLQKDRFQIDKMGVASYAEYCWCLIHDYSITFVIQSKYVFGKNNK
jgi:hypothetical protein